MFFFQDVSACIVAASSMGSKILRPQAFCQSLAHGEGFDIGWERRMSSSGSKEGFMSPIKMQRIESGLRLALDLVSFINTRALGSILGLLSEGCVVESEGRAPSDSVFKGAAEIRGYFVALFAKKKGLVLRVEELFGFGHRCVAAWEGGWEENGSRQTLRGIFIVQEKNDKIDKVSIYTKSGKGE